MDVGRVNEIFQWKELLLYVEGRKKCRKCGEKQYRTTNSKWKTALLVLPVMLIPGILRLILPLSFFTQLSLIFVLTIVCFSFMPFHYRFTDKEQALF
ncbi:TIGR04104 family putative zinc finger protein [Alkalihalobacillus sp. MEB130]|uniref:TIGR04104 family putative zinc finger protein n=1 Tax=Alkalihalobacillus sp. MEB130 TaxID=2976704 RepID=UPI0037BEC8EB